MQKLENPSCPDCGTGMKMRTRNLIYAWFCHRCRSFDGRVEIEIIMDRGFNTNQLKNTHQIPDPITLTLSYIPRNTIQI